MSDSLNEAEIAPLNGVIAASTTASENDATELTKEKGGSEMTWIDEPDTDIGQSGHLLKETVTIIESGEHVQNSSITVIVENESANAMDEPANIEVEVEIKQSPTENGSSEIVQEKVSESAEITVIEEQPSQINIEIEAISTSGDDQNSEIKLTEEDQEKLQDIYEDLFKGATIAQEEEEKEKQEDQEQQEDEEGGKRRRQCRCDCDTLLRGIDCNKKVILSKFCICGRRRRRQRAAATQQSANVSATNPAVVEQQVSTKPVPEHAQESAIEDEEPKTEEPIAKALTVEEFVTPTMQRARKQGWSFYGKFAFPLVSDVVRDFWVIGELCILLLSFIVSLVFFALDENNRKGFNIFHLILTIIASIFALIDAILQLKECTSCKAAISYHKKVKESKEEDYEVDHSEHSDDKQPKHESDSETSSQNDEGTDNATETDGNTTKCQARIEKFKDRMDIVRTLASEAIFYPLLICDLFEFITGRGYEVSNASDRLSLVLFLLSCLGIFLYVYLARIMVLCSMVVNVHKKRQKMRKNKDDPTGLYVQVYFAAHIFLQMIAQIFMIVAIAAKISFENRFYKPDIPACEGDNPPDLSCSPHASSRLWYMLIAAYVMPLCGILTFYIVCYYWITELPLTVCLDFLKILEGGSCDSFLSPIKSNKEKMQKSKGILKHYHDSLWRDFEKIYEVKFMQKLLFPFRNPVVILLCLIYAALQLAFVVCAGFSGTAVSDTFATEQITVILNDGTGWAIFFFIAAIMGALANAYVFIIAYFWLFFIIIVVLLLLLYVLCVLCELCSIVDDCMECRQVPTPNRLRRAFGV
jgi:hypothetical protein